MSSKGRWEGNWWNWESSSAYTICTGQPNSSKGSSIQLNEISTVRPIMVFTVVPALCWPKRWEQIWRFYTVVRATLKSQKKLCMGRQSEKQRKLKLSFTSFLEWLSKRAWQKFNEEMKIPVAKYLFINNPLSEAMLETWVVTYKRLVATMDFSAGRHSRTYLQQLLQWLRKKKSGKPTAWKFSAEEFGLLETT